MPDSIRLLMIAKVSILRSLFDMSDSSVSRAFFGPVRCLFGSDMGAATLSGIWVIHIGNFPEILGVVRGSFGSR